MQHTGLVQVLPQIPDRAVVAVSEELSLCAAADKTCKHGVDIADQLELLRWIDLRAKEREHLRPRKKKLHELVDVVPLLQRRAI